MSSRSGECSSEDKEALLEQLKSEAKENKIQFVHHYLDRLKGTITEEEFLQFKRMTVHRKLELDKQIQDLLKSD